MKYGGKMLACLVGSVAFCTAANEISSDASGNPYQSIIDRNVFGLKPPPPPPDPADANKAPVLKITLTGITTILGNKRVLMKTAPPPGKAGEPPKTEQSYILTEGQREGDIEVLEIDEKAGSVKVNNAGTVTTLTFEKDGAKLPATTAPAAPGVPGGAPPIPGAKPFPQPPAAAGTPSFQLPSRIPRLPTAGSQASGFSPGGAVSGMPALGTTPSYGNPGLVPGNVTLPAFQTSGGVLPQNPSPTATPASQLSIEEQAIMIEANRQAGGPGAALLPPTVLTPKANPAGEGATGSTTPVQNPVFPSIPGRPTPPY